MNMEVTWDPCQPLLPRSPEEDMYIDQADQSEDSTLDRVEKQSARRDQLSFVSKILG